MHRLIHIDPKIYQFFIGEYRIGDYPDFPIFVELEEGFLILRTPADGQVRKILPETETHYLLSLQPYSISQLASMRGLSLPAIHKHIKMLEEASMIIRKKIGRTNFLTLNLESLRSLQDWLMQYHTYWGSNEETLENYAQHLSTEKN